jgi:DNA modification methylase
MGSDQQTHQALGHTAAYPVGLPHFLILLYTDPGDVVVDPFVGSGSSIIAAERAGRRGFGIELSARYVDTTCRRWQAETGRLPVLDRTGTEHDFNP